MKRFTDSGRKALETENLYVALSLALTLPDICGSIEDPGPGKTQKRYKAWYTTWLQPTYTQPAHRGSPAKIFLTAGECFQLRNSLIHLGSSDLDQKKVVDLESIKFFDNTVMAHCIYVGSVSVGGVPQAPFLQLNAARFCRDMFDAVDKWDASVANNEAIKKEKEKLLFIHTSGATLGGISFEEYR
jgi:hypothetical protein